jgi:hypothetical protein
MLIYSDDLVNPVFSGVTIIGHTDSADFTDKADAIYDLLGRKVEKPKKGLYIVNGRKVVKH